jgi:hypothetical protein
MILIPEICGEVSAWQGVAPELFTLRGLVRLAIGCLIAVLLAYVAVEQVGQWRRRRSGRE